MRRTFRDDGSVKVVVPRCHVRRIVTASCRRERRMLHDLVRHIQARAAPNPATTTTSISTVQNPASLSLNGMPRTFMPKRPGMIISGSARTVTTVKMNSVRLVCSLRSAIS
jgi:hypothetical protein